jgi:hypothetical protein
MAVSNGFPLLLSSKIAKQICESPNAAVAAGKGFAAAYRLYLFDQRQAPGRRRRVRVSLYQLSVNKSKKTSLQARV